MKKTLVTLLAALLCIALLCACDPSIVNPSDTQTSTQGNPTGTQASTQGDPTSAPTSGQVSDGSVKTVKLSEYFGDKDIWEDDGGDVTVEEDKIVFDNGYMGDFSTLRLTETAQNVCYQFTIQLEDIPEELSEAEGTWWDAEVMILLRSTLLAPGWEDGQTGYSLTAWGDMSKVYIGRAGHDDAFGFVEWGCNDGKPHDIEFSAVNNADNTEVTLKLVVDGETVFEKVDDGSITKKDRIPLFPDEGGLTLRAKYVKMTIG